MHASRGKSVGYGAPISGLPEIGINSAQVGFTRPACA